MLGRELAHYRITGKLGVGGMGVVYEAEDRQLSRLVALKFLPEEIAGDPEAVRRLTREARMLALLNHPNICLIHDIVEHQDGTFIVMERADGVNLRMWMATRPIDTPAILNIAIQITLALEAAHAKGVVHRDIKPGNIVVSEKDAIKVLDFGLARSFHPVGPGGLPPQGSTLLGRPLGTANFMAPERLLQRPLDPRSDLFSLGVILYEMATGTLPFAGDTTEETVANILENDPLPLTTRSPGKPFELERIVSRLLKKRAEERYQTASALLEALRNPDKQAGRSFNQIVERLFRKL
jgi:serine/threonine protein kinase